MACQSAELAFEIDPLPKYLETDDVVPPPIAPADIICIKDMKGKTNAKLARGMFPNCEMK